MMQQCSLRLRKVFNELSRFGSLENGGFTRVAFTLEDLAARDWLQATMQDAGLEVIVDAVGNIRGRRAGREDLPPVMLGSHLDTVPEGGNYDGSVGVLAALEVVKLLNDRKISTRRPIEVVNFSAEESSRFGVATLGSKAMTGKLDRDLLQQLTDKDGFSFYETLQASGYHPESIELSAFSPGEIHAFIELHIEQGPVLEEQQCPIGLVTSIAAPTRLQVTVEGVAGHSGNTPMGMRQDALVGASEIVLAVEQIARNEAGERTVATVGSLRPTPGVMNVIPGKVELGIDIRDVEQSGKDRALTLILKAFDQIATNRKLNIQHKLLCNDQPVVLSEKIIATLKASSEEIGLDHLLMPSGAGHDAMNMASITDVGMIFIPSVGGVSHNIKEYSRMEDICTGTRLLLEATLKLAQE